MTRVRRRPTLDGRLTAIVAAAGVVALLATAVPLVLFGLADLSSVLTGGAVLAVVLLVLHVSVARLSARLRRIAGQLNEATGSIARERRDDDIGALVVALNTALSRQQERAGQRELHAFRLGRSESRAGLVHNVRNALSPISAILSHGLARPPIAERETIERAVGELARGDVPPERRAKLAAYVMAAIDAAARARLERLAQLETGRTALANVLEIVGQPHDGAAEPPLLERCDVTDLIARNGAIARYGDGQSIAVSFPAQPVWVCANRVILGQVIGNLFCNAGEAIAARPLAPGRIDVTVTAEAGRGVSVVIADDGDGFDPVAVPMLFQRGYSTRRAKSGGLGLHWSANWMAAMGGSLRLESDGPGHGARAILTLPAA
ncbi:HAMP domain-containing sensor histidine kinase [Sphingomonas sp. 2R-10]|uniref:sensor histidine kinase n=1 Tax=Sphingomonas sp. 2R-10 TaxID=3045148 RepID=UPI000F7AD5A6|nr:HAMP domain-containing sensor histidine kinase [Sphingomonas sp. 2R-10]MDJ0275644.1 HAMP domain-containing sensor histidine kinase [Sphingomonas sp. 2R-10]